jgi:asparagine synthase (glutamine-hydrolysing)
VCGVGGIVRRDASQPVQETALRRMARAQRHRGPDGFGLGLAPGAGFVSTRLAIFDLPCGWQPMRSGPDGSLIVYNGEVYNHPELRAELAAGGIDCRTASDTEVVLRLLERDGLAALDRFNGQFALGWWQPGPRRLTLVRDRFGVRPLHYALQADGTLVFASEAKGLFASGEVAAEPDLAGIDEVFTLWAPRPPRTAFRGVRQLPPGSLLVWENGEVVAERAWWEPDFGAGAGAATDLGELMADSVRLRLRADVPVGSYLSGGLDSSLITALAARECHHRLRTFSVAFSDPGYDERAHQERVAARLGTEHHVLEIGGHDIAAAFRDVVRHAETPLVRTAPVPLFLLARATREHGITVVATGEGADELFWGYDLFKEVSLRRAALEDPAALARFDELYPYLAADARRGPGWQRFFLDAGAPGDPLFSHQTRAAATGAVKALYRPEVAAALADPLERLRADLPGGFGGWSDHERAAYLELRTLLEPYLLAAQGDRVASAHGVEGRYPFLDHRVFAHAAALPPAAKLDGMREKAALRELAAEVLPPEIAERTKQPYRAPEVSPFFEGGEPEWVSERLSERALAETGIFDPARVAGLVRRCRAGRATGMREGMALVGVLSTQVWHEEFCAAGATGFAPETREPEVVVDMRVGTTTGSVV